VKTPTISIDLGASYTKVAYRRALERHGRQQFASADAEVAIIEGTATIPSIMIQTGDRRRPWVAGSDAAKMTPSGKMKAFPNWKSALYSSEFDAKKVELVLVAREFFAWLLEGITKLGVNCDDNCRVRVTIPALKRIEEHKEALVQCIRLSGWPDEIEVVVEPKANIIGVLSAGRNVVSATGRISYQPMFGALGPPELRYVFDEIRRYALGDRRKRDMQISVVDFGSFTLDVAKQTLDLKVIDHDTFPLQDVSANTWEVGVIGDIDRCLDELFEAHGIDGGSLSFEVKESAKVALYSGGAYAIPQGRIVLGESEDDKAIVESAIEEYCQKAWSNIRSLCQDSEVVVLTGGGTCIPHVRGYFEDELKRAGIANVVLFSVGSTSKLAERGGGLSDWQSTTEGLGRLATALGGVSIAYGFRPDEECSRY
jgi:hypothetical protein